MESAAALQKRTRSIIGILRNEYPEVRLALDFTTPLELLVALILAAQCTDERVNRTTPRLFRKYRSARAWANADRSVLETEIHSTGFFRQKAKSIQECCGALVERYRGKVPESLDDLLTLPGVGRKTANILRGNAFGQAAIGVDTHVARLAQRLGLSANDTPDRIEADLVALVPAEDQVKFCSLVQFHGRQVCRARRPDCTRCLLSPVCPKLGV